MTLKTLTCYGEPYLTHVPEDRAVALAEDHIRNCPEGPMPWATKIEWHATDWGDLCAAQGEWLDHIIRQVEYTDAQREAMERHRARIAGGSE